MDKLKEFVLKLVNEIPAIAAGVVAILVLLGVPNAEEIGNAIIQVVGAIGGFVTVLVIRNNNDGIVTSLRHDDQ